MHYHDSEVFEGSRRPAADVGAVDSIEACKRAIVEVALRGEYRAAALSDHFHQHVEALDDSLYRIAMLSLVGVVYGAIALWMVGGLSERLDKLERRVGSPLGAGIGAN